MKNIIIRMDDFGSAKASNKAILEIESLGHIGNIMPGNMVYHTEEWFVTPCNCKPSLNEDEIDEAMKKTFG